MAPTSALAAILAASLATATLATACVTGEPTTAPISDTDKRIDVPPGVISGELIAAEHQRELRAAWIATVWGIDYPRHASATAAEKEAELRNLIAQLAARGFNTIFLQVRSESDALYESSLEPWARVLTGTQGQAPGFDPLAVAISAAHDHGLELHAWLNPYRARISGAPPTASNHIANLHPELAVAYGGQLWLNPGRTEVREHVLAVIADLTARYAIDGIHFDDYFYPYPVAGQSFDDAATYNAYLTSGGSLGLADWRRDNVNALVRDVAELLAAQAPHVRFGISPFGIYRPGIPEGIAGLDAYNEIYADAPTWLANGWVDYLAPQLYWPTTQVKQSFATLLAWWASRLDNSGRFIVAGMDASSFDTSAAWSLEEMQTQLTLAQPDVTPGVRGVATFSATSVTDNPTLSDLFANTWHRPALPPPVVNDERVPTTPAFSYDAATRALAFPNAGRVALYQYVGTTWTLVDIVVAPASRTLAEGSFAVAAVGPNDRQSQVVVITAIAGQTQQ